MAKKPPRFTPESLALYEKLVATQPSVERKGDTVPYTSTKGRMFSFITTRGTLALRLPLDLRDALIAKGEAAPCEQYGVIMPDFAEFPADALKNTRTIAKHFAASYAHASSLKPKPTTRKKKVATKTKPAKRSR